MIVGEYLIAPRPAWDWVRHDCCRWVDRWVVLNGHASPMQAIAIEYDSERSALRRIAEGGGLCALWTLGMLGAGTPEVHADQVLLPGDVGVIRRETICSTDEAMAIWTGDKWASLALRGIECGPAEALRVWRP